MANLEKNLQSITARIAAACERARRSPDDVTLVAVTKTVTTEVVRELVALRVRDIGENRIQEAAHKRTAIPDQSVRWHMIGHLQSNKVKDALKLFNLIHSIDSVHLAEALEARAAFQNIRAPILIQVNVSGEESKYGFPRETAITQVRRIAEFPHISIQGLMTMAPLVEDAESVRPVFRALREIRDEIASLGLPDVEMRHLSMGMTQDFEVAIEEGATLVRIGTALFR